LSLFTRQIARQVVPESSIARVSAVAVMGVMLLVQIIAVAQMHLNDRRYESDALVNAEFHRLEAVLDVTPPEWLSTRADFLLQNNLRGLLIATAAGKPVLVLGDIPNASVVPNIVNEGAGEWTTNSPGHADVLWQLSTESGAMSAIMRVDISPAISAAWSHTFKRALYALFGMLITGIMALWLVNRLVNRYFVKPTAALVEHIEAWQEPGEEETDPQIACEGAPHLQPLADSFSSLIEQQKKSDRQVRVKQKYLEFAAHHDPLTHLPNRLMFEDTLKQTVSNARENESRFAVFLVDLDNFKIFNDQYGHVVGDRMVAEVGNRLRSLMRDSDLVARLDGDEFAVIQNNVPDRQRAEEVAKRLMLEANAPFEYRGFTLKIAVTVGISCFPQDVQPDQHQDAIGEEIVNNASVALQEAKTTGKNQYQFFNESMRSRLTARIRLEQDLKLAIQENQFEVWYQPKINIQTRKVVGSEALVRWKHPVKGYISPEVFVPVAEEAGMIIELGEWILRTACRKTQELQEMGYTGIGVAVNISAVQFTDGNLLPMVSRALKESSLNPRLLELEITESAVMHDPEDVIKSLHELSQFGMSLAIDDFGTGYSSLAYLKRFPVDTLKIDRAFIMDVSSDSDDVAIVESILGLGKHFNMKVVAEGVEDEEQLNFLKNQGCDVAQGFYISRPQNFDKFVEWMRAYGPGFQSSLDDGPDSDDLLPKRNPAPVLGVLPPLYTVSTTTKNGAGPARTVKSSSSFLILKALRQDSAGSRF